MVEKLTRRGFLFGSATAVASTAMSSVEAKADFFGDLTHTVASIFNGPAARQAEADERPASGRKGGDGGAYSRDTPAFRYYAQIGQAIVEGRYHGKIDVANLTYKEKVWSFRLKPVAGAKDFEFDKASFAKFCVCKSGAPPPREVFEPQWVATLGMLVYHMEECTPDRPAAWPAGKDYAQDAELASVYRAPAYNRKVGGARGSRHLSCAAVDWVGIGGNAGKPQLNAKEAYGAAVSDEVEDIHGGAVFYPANKKRGAFFHTDTGRDRGDWNDLGDDFMVSEMAAFKAWQKKNGVTPFSLAGATRKAPAHPEPTPKRDSEPQVASAEKKPVERHAAPRKDIETASIDHAAPRKNAPAPRQPAVHAVKAEPPKPLTDRELVDSTREMAERMKAISDEVTKMANEGGANFLEATGQVAQAGAPAKPRILNKIIENGGR